MIGIEADTEGRTWMETGNLEKEITAPIIGANSVEPLGANLSANSISLGADQMRKLRTLRGWRQA